MESFGRHHTTPVDEIRREECETLFRLAIAEDAPQGDPTSESIFPPDAVGKGRIFAKEAGRLCGIEAIRIFLELFQEETGGRLEMEAFKKDGDPFQPGDTLLLLRGPLRSLLRAERIILNLLQYLSGITTVVSRAVESVGENLHLLDTRKTLPGYRHLAKYAVFCGGGGNHRITLSDLAMIKDNHIAAAGGVLPAIRKIRASHPDLPLEVETDTIEQVREAVTESPDIILLDNMELSTVREAVAIIRDSSPKTRIEVSGGITPEHLRALAGIGGIYVSMGYFTHTTRFLDISMEIEEERKG